MIDIKQKYKDYCDRLGIKYQDNLSVLSYDDSTLFCPAGMQQFKNEFKDNNYQDIVSNIQPCIRMNDFDEIGDSTHLLYFNMMGLFAFRKMSISDAIYFWISFIQKELDLKIDYVTVHPDKINDPKWMSYYTRYGIPIKEDSECTWTDGEIGGYCTEFYINDIEIGNIVNPLDNCIDCGFGLERLELLVNNSKIDKISTLKNTCLELINAGIKPSNTKQGYVLRKLLREIYKMNDTLDHQFFIDEVKRQREITRRYNILKEKHSDKSPEWWFDTHGININEISEN